MPKKTYIALTAVLTCLALSAAAYASESAEIAYTEEITAVSQAEETSEKNPDTNPDTNDPDLPQTAAEPSDVEEVPAEEANEPVYVAEPFDPSKDPVPNNTAPPDGGLFYGQGEGDIENIRLYWETNGYPDYVSYAADNSVAEYNVATQTETIHRFWDIGTVNADEEQKREILSLISSECRVSFSDCMYSHNERLSAAEEIKAMYPDANTELDENGVDIYVRFDGYTEEDLKKIQEDIYLKYNGGISDFIFVVGNEEIGVPETAVEITAVDAVGTEQIPDGVGQIPNSEFTVPAVTSVEFTAYNNGSASAEAGSLSEIGAVGYDLPNATFAGEDEIGVIDNEKEAALPETAVGSDADEKSGEIAAIVTETPTNEGGGLWIWLCAVAAAVLVIAAALIIGRSKRSDSLSLADGGEINAGGRLGKAEIEKAVRESEIKPSDVAYERIMEKISEEEK